ILSHVCHWISVFFFQAEDGIRDRNVTGVQTCALPIYYPQAAILQVESIVTRPMIVNNMFAAREMVNLSLSLDHRILDGLVCGQFLARVKDILEKMNQDTTNVY